MYGDYHKVASSNKSRLVAHTGFFRLLMKGIFNPYANKLKKVFELYALVGILDVSKLY